ncbi:phytanoyl-CoA dioxygenase family protein [Algirhabdus cladophorae]|uniref:phytanoyl-CoA dioxygenase family protein n=1 Tax=Algirhabdus cladophorae TaxID=3377108 RepID=UPI003B849EE3
MLSPAQLAQFRTQGYLVVPNVLEPAILDAVRAEYAALLDQLCTGWGIAGGNFEEQLINAYRAGHDWFQPMDISLPGDQIMADTPMHFGPAVFDMVRSPRILAMVEQLIGPEITSNPIQHVRIKPPVTHLAAGEIRPHVGGTAWHQDRAVALAEADETDMVTVWLAITEATVENGCLQVAPMAEGREMLPHCPQVQTSIADGFIDEAAATPLPVPAGGCVVFDPMVPHASLPNTSDGIRWSFDLRYNRTGQPTGRSHFPEFVAQSRANPTLEMHDWRAWKSMWEDTRAQLAQRPHTNIHRWTSDAPFCA